MSLRFHNNGEGMACWQEKEAGRSHIIRIQETKRLQKSIETKRTQVCGLEDWYYQTIASIVAILPKFINIFAVS